MRRRREVISGQYSVLHRWQLTSDRDAETVTQNAAGFLSATQL